MASKEQTPGRGRARTEQGELSNLNSWSIKPIRLLIRNIGPFRGEDPYVLDFAGPRMTSDRASTMRTRADMFMIVGENGTGKSTILDCIAGLFDQLNDRPEGAFAAKLSRDSWAMVDLLVTYRDGKPRQSMMLHLWIGSEDLRPRTTSPTAPQYAHHRDAYLGLVATRPSEISKETCGRGLQFLRRVRSDIGTRYSKAAKGSLEVPTVLYFRPSWLAKDLRSSVSTPREFIQYRPIHEFAGGDEIRGSSLADYVHWRSEKDQRFYDGFLKHLNEKMFKNFKSSKRLFHNLTNASFDENSWAMVDPEGQEEPELGFDRRKLERFLYDRRERSHDLSELSSGERMLLHLYAWIDICSRRSTIILIDEIDMHLGRSRAQTLLNDLEDIAWKAKNTTVIFTTHDRALIDAFSKGANFKNRRGGVHISMEAAE